VREGASTAMGSEDMVAGCALLVASDVTGVVVPWNGGPYKRCSRSCYYIWMSLCRVRLSVLL
jgi:hypothetical protein